jgi:hypothetical protein
MLLYGFSSWVQVLFYFFLFSFFLSVLINFMISCYVINNIYILEEK